MQLVHRESPEIKRRKIENNYFAKATEASTETKKKYDELRAFSCLSELKDHLTFVDQEYWTVINSDAKMIFIHVITNPAPKIAKSLVIQQDLQVLCYNDGLKLEKLSKFSFPCLINNINEINEILTTLKEIDMKKIENHTSVILSVIDTL